MSKEERHLQTKIRMFEDILLRTKNPSQVDNIQMELTRMRAKLQKLYFKRIRCSYVSGWKSLFFKIRVRKGELLCVIF